MQHINYPLLIEISTVVGGGGNRFTELRRHLKRDGKVSVKTQNILSTFELRGFYIKISQGKAKFKRFFKILERNTDFPDQAFRQAIHIICMK